MAFEKRYTARQVAEAVMAKTRELLEKHEPMKKAEMEKCGTFTKVHANARKEGYSEASADKIAGKAKAMEKAEVGNSKKENAKPSQHGAKDADQHAEGKAPKGEIHPKEAEQAPSDDVRGTPAPGNNPKEQAEGNNELAGTTPTQVGQDGKNILGGDEIKGHLKLAKFCGYMEAKRQMRAKAAPMAKTELDQKLHNIRAAQEIKGVHKPEEGTHSEAGIRTKMGLNSKKQHSTVLAEMKAMPKPKLPG